MLDTLEDLRDGLVSLFSAARRTPPDHTELKLSLPDGYSQAVPCIQDVPYIAATCRDRTIKLCTVSIP